MSDKKREYTGHDAPRGVVINTDLPPVIGTGHPAPARVDPVNVAPKSPPPKRDDAGSSGKPPR